MPRKITTEEFIEKSKQLHGNKYDYSKVKYINNHTKVTIICPIHGEFEQIPSNHLRKRGCPKCAGKNKTTEEFVEEALKVHGNKYDYSKVQYRKNSENVCIICPKHGEFWQTPSNHLYGQGCPKCGRKRTNESRRLNTESFIQKALKIHGDRYNYSRVNYINSTTKVCIICPKHGEFYQKPDNHLQGQGCPCCKQSHLENFIFTLLQENNIAFEPQKTFDWLKNIKTGFNLYLDFYLPEYNIAIECQGKQHFSSIDYFGGEKGLTETIERDKLKLFLCNSNNIKILYYSDKSIDIPDDWNLYEIIRNEENLLNIILKLDKNV